MIAILGGFAGAIAGQSPYRSSALALTILGAPSAIVAATLALVDRRGGIAAAVAVAAALFVFGSNAMTMHERWAILAPRRASIVPILILAALFAFAFLALRSGLGWAAARIPPRVKRRGGFILAILGGALVATGMAPRDASEPPLPSPPKGPNLLLVTVDTLRADHVSAYGYDAHQTATLDRIAREGARFDAAFAPSPWTLPSLSSLLTGYYPSALGVDKRTGLPPGLPTLASLLGESGYETHAIVTNVYLDRVYDLDRGFRGYDHLYDLGAFDDLAGNPLHHLAQKVKLKLLGDGAGRVTARALEWLRSRAEPSRPFFLWLHYMDPHQPYGGPHVHGDLPCGSREAPALGEVFDDARLVRRGRKTLTAPEREHLVHLYDADIRYFDRELGRLLDELDRSGVAGSTLLVLTADHGEEFWEHGGFEHGHSLYPEVTRVPLLLRWPGRVAPGEIVARPVSLVDLMPTLLHAAGVASPQTQGQRLPPFDSAGADRPVLSENILYGPEQKAVRDEQRSLLHRVAEGAWEEYDRAADPAELSPLGRSPSEDLRAFLLTAIDGNREIHTRLAGGGLATSPDLSAFQREQLRALGYVD